VSTQCEQDMLDLDGRKSFIKEVVSVAAELQAADRKLPNTPTHTVVTPTPSLGTVGILEAFSVVVFMNQ
jgi:hypothetical protein